MPVDHRQLLKLFKKILDNETVLIGFLVLVAIMGFNLAGRLSSLKAQNTALSDNFDKLKEGLAAMQAKDGRVAELMAENTDLKYQIMGLKLENAARPNTVLPDPANGALRAENAKLKEENSALSAGKAKLQSKYEKLQAENEELKKNSVNVKSLEMGQNDLKSNNDLLGSENKRLQAENERLRGLINLLQVKLIRVFDENGSSDAGTPPAS